MKADQLKASVGLLVFMAVTASVCSVAWCETADFTLVQGANEKEISFGTWRYNTFALVQSSISGEVWKVNTCASYPDSTVKDIYWKVAQAFSIIAPIWGAFSWLPMLKVSADPGMAKTAGAMLMLATLFQGLTLLLWKSEVCDATTNPFLDGFTTTQEHCALGKSAIFSIVGICLYFLSGAIALAIPIDADDVPVSSDV